VAFAGDPRPLAIGNCYLGEPDDRPADRAVTGGGDVELGAVWADDGLPRASGAVLFGHHQAARALHGAHLRKWRVSSVCPCRRRQQRARPLSHPIHHSDAGRSRAEAKAPTAPVTGPGDRSGEKTGMNRRTADARFSTTGSISPGSP